MVRIMLDTSYTSPSIKHFPVHKGGITLVSKHNPFKVVTTDQDPREHSFFLSKSCSPNNDGFDWYRYLIRWST